MTGITKMSSLLLLNITNYLYKLIGNLLKKHNFKLVYSVEIMIFKIICISNQITHGGPMLVAEL